MWRSLVARVLWEHDVAGSNPVIPTSNKDCYEPYVQGDTPVKSSVEQLTSTRVKLTVEVPFDELKDEFDKAYATIANQVNIPGFRKGHAPAKVLESHVGRGAILETVFNDMLPSRYEEACNENNVYPLGSPDIDLTKIDDPNSFEFTAEVDCRPEIKLPKFEDMEVEVEPRKAIDEVAAQGLADLQERFAVLKGVERPVEEKDFVSIDLDATIDGEPVPEASTKGLSHQVGKGDLIEGLDDTLVGMKEGETREFKSKLMAGESAGEEADVSVTVTKVQEQELPELDDDFAQMASEFDTIDELKDDMQRRAEAAAQSEQASNIRDAVLKHLTDTIEFDVPEGIVEEQAQARINQVMSQFGNDENMLKTILESQNSSLEQFYEEAKEGALTGVRSQLLLDVIAEERGIEISQNDLTEAVVAQAQQYNMDPEQFVKLVQQQGQLSNLFTDVRRNKALFAVIRDFTAKDTDGKVIDDLGAFFDDLPDAPAAEATE